eukprot:gb/GEZN01022344.1/.p1 GENE.gb/GEZN01022344.1/~~gb/GEZN01022344.1/.p1  ORF type:complete len:143 (+),score=24.71 gb/GEZN01022344.1/:95-523(+)
MADGVKVTTLKAGDKKTYPKAGDELSMHYVGTLTNGSKFDSSRDKSREFKFNIGKGMVIKGWDVGVMKMSLGELAKLEIKSHYGYGASGAGGVIPPNADLVFEVELLAINGTRAAGGGGGSGGSGGGAAKPSGGGGGGCDIL